ncbi:MAG: hypothetical protein HC804_09580 [Anaerolineae bacterium]|nr:hypothetical protein [Anaerolineae bacterium]
MRTNVEVTTTGVPGVDGVPGGNNQGGGKDSGKWAGGSVFPTNGYIVGERGPEFFRPASPGTIIPHNQMMGSTMNGGGGATFNIYQQPGESGEELANRISQILGKRTRQIRAAGG